MKGNDKIPQHKCTSRKLLVALALIAGIFFTAALVHTLRGDVSYEATTAIPLLRGDVTPAAVTERDTVERPAGKAIVTNLTVDLSKKTAAMHTEPERSDADDEKHKTCGSARRRGRISTLEITTMDGGSMTALFCGNAAGRPVQLAKPHVRTRPLFVGVTSPCGNVEFR